MDRQDSKTSPDSMNANKEESTKNDGRYGSLSNENELYYLISLIRNWFKTSKYNAIGEGS